MKKRVIALALGCTVAFGCAVGGTLAWLTADGGTVTNTFTVGDVKIELTETGTENGAKNYNFVPGDKLAKDPKVTVQATTEPCYVFLKMTESNMIKVKDDTNKDVNALNYEINTSNWTKLTVEDASAGVTYYYKGLMAQTTEDTHYYILTDNKVTVSEFVTKDNVVTLNENKPKLEFAAAAIQSANVGGLSGAWEKLPSSFKGDATYTVTP